MVGAVIAWHRLIRCRCVWVWPQCCIQLNEPHTHFSVSVCPLSSVQAQVVSVFLKPLLIGNSETIIWVTHCPTLCAQLGVQHWCRCVLWKTAGSRQKSCIVLSNSSRSVVQQSTSWDQHSSPGYDHSALPYTRPRSLSKPNKMSSLAKWDSIFINHVLLSFARLSHWLVSFKTLGHLEISSSQSVF